MQRHTKVQLAVGLLSGLACLAVQEYWFGAFHQVVRDWGFHWLAVVCAASFTALLLYSLADDVERRWKKLALLACLVPVAISSLHELGQWIWPKADRDDFDSLRDFGLNLLGGIASWLLLTRVAGKPPSPATRRD